MDEGGLDSKLQAVTDEDDRPAVRFLTQHQIRINWGAKLFYSTLPDAEPLIADKGHDSDEFLHALSAKGIEPCIPPELNQTLTIPDDTKFDKQPYKIEFMFSRLKDWRRIARRYDQCAYTFFSAISFTAAAFSWL